MPSIRDDKIYIHFKADGTRVFFRYDINEAGGYIFTFQTGTAPADALLVTGSPPFINQINYPGPTINYGDVLDPLMFTTVLFADGTALAPSIAFASEPSLGFYRAGPGIVGLHGSLQVSGTIASGGDITINNGASLSSLAATRRAGQMLNFDGTNSVISNIPAFSTADFTIGGILIVPNITGDNKTIFGCGISTGFYAQVMVTSGLVRCGMSDSSFTATSSIAVVPNQSYQFLYRRASGVGTLKLNNVVVWTGADTSNYANPITQVGRLYIYSPFVGQLGQVFAGNAATSSTEEEVLFRTGIFPQWFFPATPAGTALITGDNSTFASDTGFWTKGAGVTINNAGDGVATIPTGQSIRRVALTAGGGTHYRLAGTVVSMGAGAIHYANEVETATVLATATGPFAVDFVDRGTGILNIDFVGAGQAVIDNVTLTPLGALVASDPNQLGSGLIWYDSSGNGANLTLPGSGVTWAQPAAPVTPANSLLTSAPVGGTAGVWKLGSLVTAVSVFDTTRYIQLDVGGVLYKLALCA